MRSERPPAGTIWRFVALLHPKSVTFAPAGNDNQGADGLSLPIYLIMYKKLFTTFFKIGAFTLGGGYAMIPIIESEVVEKNKWIEKT